MFRTQA